MRLIRTKSRLARSTSRQARSQRSPQTAVQLAVGTGSAALSITGFVAVAAVALGVVVGAFAAALSTRFSLPGAAERAVLGAVVIAAGLPATAAAGETAAETTEDVGPTSLATGQVSTWRASSSRRNTTDGTSATAALRTRSISRWIARCTGLSRGWAARSMR